MYICYIDESGTSAVPGTSTHFVLAGISIPIQKWRVADLEITEVLKKYDLEDQELHTAWMLRKYIEQTRVPNFDGMDRPSRRSAVTRERARNILAIQKSGATKQHRQTKKNYTHTAAYIHLTHAERVAAINDVAETISRWDFAALFAECIDKIYFDPVRTNREIDEQALKQVVSRFQQYLSRNVEPDAVARGETLGILVHDNNQSMAKKHTELMRQFHNEGTLWTKIDNIIETPLFVDSKLTRMVQIADLCSYALRRYSENGEAELFQKLFTRADMVKGKAVGVRHYANHACHCAICVAHR